MIGYMVRKNMADSRIHRPIVKSTGMTDKVAEYNIKRLVGLGYSTEEAKKLMGGDNVQASA